MERSINAISFQGKYYSPAVPSRTTTLTLAVDTGATVNVLSDNAFRALKRNSRGGSWPLYENNLNVVGVTGSDLEVLGRVFLTVCLQERLRPFHDEFYVSSKFSLPVDGILGLKTMRNLGMLIQPGENSIIYKGRVLRGLTEPSAMASLPS